MMESVYVTWDLPGHSATRPYSAVRTMSPILTIRPDLTKPVPETVLIVTDSFGSSLNPHKKFESEGKLALAETLASAGHRVSVLYTEYNSDDHSAFKTAQKNMAAQGITLTRYLPRVADNISSRLEPTGVFYGENIQVEALSYEVYQFIIHQPDQFAVVHFSAVSGAGYYTLLAQQQGLICSETKYVLGVDNLAPGSIETMNQGDPENYVVTNANTLKKDFMMEKTIEWAVRRVNHSLIHTYIHTPGYHCIVQQVPF